MFGYGDMLLVLIWHHDAIFMLIHVDSLKAITVVRAALWCVMLSLTA
jgi:hypothetical protein